MLPSTRAGLVAAFYYVRNKKLILFVKYGIIEKSKNQQYKKGNDNYG